MTDSTDDELRGIAEREQAATKGPWFTVGPPWLPSNCTTYVIAGSDDPHAGVLVCDFNFIGDREQEDNSWNDAEFIAHARADVPTLLAEVERLRGEHRAALNEVQRLRECADAALARVKELEKELEGGCRD